VTRKFGLNGATTGPRDLRTDIQAAREAGYQAVELRDAKIQAYLNGGRSLYALRTELADAGLEVASVNALERSTLATGGARQAVLRRCRQLSEWAAALDCPYVVAVPSPLADTREPNRIPEVTADALREMASVAKPYGVRIGFEFLGFAACSVNTLAKARQIVDAVRDPSVGLVIDAFHFYAGWSTWGMLDGLKGEQIFMVHLDDAEKRPRDTLTDEHRLLPGEGAIPLKDLVRQLDRLGYRGIYSIELFRPEYYEWEPAKLAKVALEKMEALFAPPAQTT
jgi:2-keto-myo-inositol isomerase